MTTSRQAIMLSRVRHILSSKAFLVTMALCGLILFSWPLMTILSGRGLTGQLLSIYGVWFALVLGALAWSVCQGGKGGDPGDQEEHSCAWPPDKREGR